MLPKGRKEDYAIWRACERFGIMPPDTKSSWDDNNVWIKCKLIAYNQLRDLEEAQE